VAHRRLRPLGRTPEADCSAALVVQTPRRALVAELAGAQGQAHECAAGDGATRQSSRAHGLAASQRDGQLTFARAPSSRWWTQNGKSVGSKGQLCND
jgi:hypothetical protein